MKEILNHAKSEFNSRFSKAKSLDLGLALWQTQQEFLTRKPVTEQGFAELPATQQEMYAIMAEQLYLLGCIEMKEQLLQFYDDVSSSVFSRHRLLDKEINPEFYAREAELLTKRQTAATQNNPK